MNCLTTQVQSRLVRERWPTFKTLRRSRSAALWEGTLRPLCKTYTVWVGLRRSSNDAQTCAPFVLVVDPILRHRPDAPEEPIPHIYANPHPRLSALPVLCLYHPPSGEWHGGMPIAKTIIPWAVQWLVCYEGWLATGEWAGGGIH